MTTIDERWFIFESSCKLRIWKFIRKNRTLTIFIFFTIKFFKTISTKSSSIKRVSSKKNINHDWQCLNSTTINQAFFFQRQYAHLFLRSIVNYVFRSQLHRKIQKQLHDRKNDKIEKMQILIMWKLEKTSKSQFVLNCIQKHRENYRTIFWIEANSSKTIKRDYIQIYAFLYNRSTIKSQETIKLKNAISTIKRWF